MSRARFVVIGRLDNASKITKGTITIDREAGTFEVRPHRRRKVYVASLSAVAEMVVQRLIMIELAERRRAKKAKRKGHR